MNREGDRAARQENSKPTLLVIGDSGKPSDSLMYGAEFFREGHYRVTNPRRTRHRMVAKVGNAIEHRTGMLAEAALSWV